MHDVKCNEITKNETFLFYFNTFFFITHQIDYKNNIQYILMVFT